MSIQRADLSLLFGWFGSCLFRLLLPGCGLEVFLSLAVICSYISLVVEHRGIIWMRIRLEV